MLTPQAYGELVHSMQPIYGQTRGLGNKAIVKAQTQALQLRQMEREYVPATLRKRYELAEINYAVERIRFPADQSELLLRQKTPGVRRVFPLSGGRAQAEGKAAMTLALCDGVPGGGGAVSGSSSLPADRSPGADPRGGVRRFRAGSGDEPPDPG